MTRSLHLVSYGNYTFSASKLSSESLHCGNNVILYRFLQEGEKWQDGPCKLCECRGAQVTCYEPSCPPCPVATLAQVVKGQCCPDCTSGGSMSSLFLLRCFYCQKFREISSPPTPCFIFFSHPLDWFVCLFLIFLTNDALSMYLPNSTDYEYVTLHKSLVLSES